MIKKFFNITLFFLKYNTIGAYLCLAICRPNVRHKTCSVFYINPYSYNANAINLSLLSRLATLIILWMNDVLRFDVPSSILPKNCELSASYVPQVPLHKMCLLGMLCPLATDSNITKGRQSPWINSLSPSITWAHALIQHHTKASNLLKYQEV